MPMTENELYPYFLPLYKHKFAQKELVEIIACTQIVGGWESDLFALHLSYQEADTRFIEEVVMKIYHEQSGALKAKREFDGMKQLALSGYRVPQVLFVAEADAHSSWSCVVMEKIQGRTLGKVIAISSPSEQDAIVMRFCQLLVALHTMDWKPFVVDPASYQADAFICSRLTEICETTERLQPQVFEPVIEWLEARKQIITCQHFSVIHGDFHPGNVLVREDGTLFVIDWPGVEVSDYRFDLAWTFLLMSTQSQRDLGTVVLSEYERLLGHSIEYFDFFLVISCLRRILDMLVSLSGNATSLGMKPGVEKMMRKKVDHIRLVYQLLQEKTGCSLPEIEQSILTFF